MSTPPSIDRRQAAHDAAAVVTRARTAALGTLDRKTGTPYVSHVGVACGTDLQPVLLLSGLAMHSRNLAADPRASLLFTDTPDADTPMAIGRATLLGSIRKSDDTAARDAYLARHAQAAAYAALGDFEFYVLDVDRVHFVGGFGRTVELSKRDFAA